MNVGREEMCFGSLRDLAYYSNYAYGFAQGDSLNKQQ